MAAVVALGTARLEGNESKCPKCSGSGQVRAPCTVCGGSGHAAAGKACHGCGGSGQRFKFCRKCNGTGKVDASSEATDKPASPTDTPKSKEKEKTP